MRARIWAGFWCDFACRAGRELTAARLLMVADHFIDDEAQELLAELRVQLGLFRERAQPGDLSLLARRIGGGQRLACLVLAHFLRDAEAFRQHVNDRGIDVVDTLAIPRQRGIGGVIARGNSRFVHPLAR